jgi:O-antigen/teichoic acid export membrane protein
VELLGHRKAAVRQPGAVDRRLGRSAAVLGAAGLAVGSVSFVFIFVGSRLLGDDEMADLLTLWAIVNTTVLSLLIPLDTLAPRMLLGGDSTRAVGTGQASFVVHGSALGVGGGLVAISIAAVATTNAAGAVLAAGLCYCGALGGWSGLRARLVGAGEYASVLGLASLTAFVAVAGLVAVHVAAPSSAWVLLACVATAYVVGLAAWVGRGVEGRLSRRDWRWRQLSLGRSNYRTLAALVAVTFATLALNNGGLALARAIGMDSRRIVVYAAALSLVRIPMMLVNNLTPPVNLRVVELSANESWREVRALAAKTFALFAGVVALGVIATGLVGAAFVEILAAGSAGVDRTIVVLALVGEGIIWLTVLPRIVCVALHTDRPMIVAWAAGLVTFVVWIVLPLSAEARVVGAPIAGGLVTLVVSSGWVLRLLHDREVAAG